MLNVGSIWQSFDNLLYESNTINASFIDLPFDGDERLITKWQIYFINGDVIEWLNNGSIIDLCINRM